MLHAHVVDIISKRHITNSSLGKNIVIQVYGRNIRIGTNLDDFDEKYVAALCQDCATLYISILKEAGLGFVRLRHLTPLGGIHYASAGGG
jgi:hypothetical protein